MQINTARLCNEYLTVSFSSDSGNWMCQALIGSDGLLFLNQPFVHICVHCKICHSLLYRPLFLLKANLICKYTCAMNQAADIPAYFSERFQI